MFATRYSCPQCSCASVRRSRRRLYDWPMRVLGLKAARCTSCGLRFYRNSSKMLSSRHAAQG